MTRDAKTRNWRDTESVRRGVVREINERVASLSLQFADQDTTSTAQFFCECGDVTCLEPVIVTLGLYERVRVEPRRYLIAINHEDPETETVITSGEHHAVVETLAGTASKIAEATDPRRSARFAELKDERVRTLRTAQTNGTR